jgi:hypothetical protein
MFTLSLLSFILSIIILDRTTQIPAILFSNALISCLIQVIDFSLVLKGQATM